MNAWTILRSKSEYQSALERMEELSVKPPHPDSEKGKELMLLGYLLDKYEDETFPVRYPDPVAAIKIRMADLDLSVNDLLDVFGDRGTASKVLNRRRSLSISMIRTLSKRLGLPEALLIRPYAFSQRTRSTAKANEPKAVYQRRSRRKGK